MPVQTGTLALAGGILTGYDVIRHSVVTKLSVRYPKLSIISPKQDAAAGAAAMALY